MRIGHLIGGEFVIQHDAAPAKLLEEVSKNMGKTIDEKPHTDTDTKK